MAAEYFRANPHRLHLGMIELVMKKQNGSKVTLKDIDNAQHSLDLWEGKITSHFEIEGVEVEIYAHQDQDMISARIESPLITQGRLGIQWKFPYGVTKHKMHNGYDFTQPNQHESMLEKKLP